jgi:hypothetical protein
VVAAVAVAAAAGIGLHTFGPVDAMHQVLSASVATPAGTVLLGTACAALVVAARLLSAAAWHTGRSGPVRALLGLWAAGLIALAVFPTNLPGAEVTTSTIIHRYGAAIAMAAPPLIALLVARTRRLRTAALITGGATAAYGLAHIPAILAGTTLLPYAGLWERVLLVLMLVLVLLTDAELEGTGPDLHPAGGLPDGERGAPIKLDHRAALVEALAASAVDGSAARRLRPHTDQSHEEVS